MRVTEDHPRQWWQRIAVPGHRPRALLELLVIAAMFGAYKLGRIVAAKHVGTAFDNAYVVWDLERILRLPDELSVQALMLKSTAVIKAANVYYVAVHFPATAAFLIWLYLRRPGDYLWIRRTLALLTASGLLVHLAIPVAPPRMLSTLGFIDTAAVYGPAVYGPPAQNSLADQYAAMPSLHIGWAIMVALGVIVTTRTRWRWLIVLHPAVTTFVVIGTANHFWLDGMVAAGLLATSLVVVRSVTALTEPRIEVPDFVPVLDSPARAELPSPAGPSVAPPVPAPAPAAPATAAPAAPAPASLTQPVAAPASLASPHAAPASLTPPVATSASLAQPVAASASLAQPARTPASVASPAQVRPGLSGPIFVPALPDRLPAPVRAAPVAVAHPPAHRRRRQPSGLRPEDLADVAGDRGDR